MAVTVVVGSQRLRRADYILEAVRKEIDKRRSAINNDGDIQTVTIVVKMKAKSESVRATLLSVQTEYTTAE